MNDGIPTRFLKPPNSGCDPVVSQQVIAVSDCYRPSQSGGYRQVAAKCRIFNPNLEQPYILEVRTSLANGHLRRFIRRIKDGD